MGADFTADSGTSSRGGELRAEIARGIVALHKEIYGKGPVKVKVHVHDDSVTALMRGGFMPVEQALHDIGKAEAVTQQRLEVKEAMRTQYTALIERATGRSVVGFMSGAQQDPDLQCEIFVLTGSDLLADDSDDAGSEPGS